jgi:hypothetical protein
MNHYRLMTVAAAVLIAAGLILALGRATNAFEVGSTTLVTALTMIGVILAAGAAAMKRRGPGKP